MTDYYQIESRCRLCQTEFDTNTAVIASYEMLPIAGAYIDPDLAGEAANDPAAPLTMLQCSDCALVQLEQSLLPVFYKNYSFFGGIGQTYKTYLQGLAQDVSDAISDKACVLEIGCGDGTFLELLQQQGHQVFGFEPAEHPAGRAQKKGLPVSSRYFSDSAFIESGYPDANCIVIRHVLEHIDNFESLFAGINQAATEDTLLIIEVPDLAETVNGGMYGNIYHPHACYFDQETMKALLHQYGWVCGESWIVPIFGGSLFVAATRRSAPVFRPGSALHHSQALSGQEVLDFGEKWQQYAFNIAAFIRDLTSEDATVSGYGAAERTCSIIGAAGLNTSDVNCLYDKNPNLAGKCIPRTRIPIHHPDEIATQPPDYMVIFAQSNEAEIIEQLQSYRQAGGKCISLQPDGPVILG